MKPTDQVGADGFVDRGALTTRTETFVDAAFAFAVTLLVVMVDAVPGNVDELRNAFKAVPAFAASFAIIAMFWYSHHRWSRRFGLEDGVTVMLSLLLVFLVLVYVYPLRMLTASLFHWLSGGWLAAGFSLNSARDLLDIYVAYGFGFAALSGVLWLLYMHAWRLRDRLGLSAEERIGTRIELRANALIASTGLLSAVVALTLPARDSVWLLMAPGLCYNLLLLLPWLLRRQQRHLESIEGAAPLSRAPSAAQK